MKYYIRYELEVEAENEKKLNQKLSLIDMQVRQRDKKYRREIVDDDNWYTVPLVKDNLDTMEF